MTHGPETSVSVLQSTLEVEVKGAEVEEKDVSRSKAVAAEVFSTDVVWTDFSFGGANATRYDKACPEGGPGGLICCEACASLYSEYLNSTVKDIESQRINQTGNEVKELLQFLKEGKEALDYAYSTARSKVPPLPPPASAEQSVPKASSSSSGKVGVDSSEFNMTSVLDLGGGTVHDLPV